MKSETQIDKDFQEDVLSVLCRTANGREAISVLLDSLRGGYRAPVSPESGRRWRGIGTLSNFERLLEDAGFRFEKVYNESGCTLRTYVTV